MKTVKECTYIWLERNSNRNELDSTAKIISHMQMLNASYNLLRANKPRSISKGNMELFDLSRRRLNNVSPEGPDILRIRATIRALLLDLKLPGLLVR